jgi:hypothetical protein
MTSVLIKSFKPLLESLQQQQQDDDDDNSIPITIAKQLVSRVCRGNKKWRKCDNNAAAALPASILGAPALVPMASKEVEVEEMMFRMKHGLKGKPSGKERSDDDDDKRDDASGGRRGAAGNPGLDVYSRDEMMGMREALQRGDREKLMELDPQSAELSDEEFHVLAQMHRNEFGSKK